MLPDDAVAEGFGDGFRLGVDLQLGVDVLHVERHGMDAAPQCGRGGLVTVALREQAA